MPLLSDRFTSRSLLFTILSILACLAPLHAQPNMKPYAPTANDREVPILRKYGVRHSGVFNCLDGNRETRVVEEKEFTKIKTDKDCDNLREFLKSDFKNESMIAFTVGGDCFISGAAKVFRDDKAKKYTVSVKRIYGGCRAAGTFEGWFTIKKIPEDYTIEYVRHTFDNIHYPDSVDDDSYDDFWASADDFRLITKAKKNTETVETREVDMKGCVRSFGRNQFVIKDKETFLKTIRSDASRAWCEKNLGKFDFDKYSLLGVAASSNYCYRPPGLKYEVLKDASNKQYLFRVSYPQPKEGICRRIGYFDVWLLVPKIPDGFDVKFDVKTLL